MSDFDGVASRIKALRKAAKMTQGQLAEKVGVTNSAISKFEAGISAPTFGTAQKIAGVYNVSAEYILAGVTPLLQTQAQKLSPYPAGQTNVTAVGLLSDIPVIKLRHVSVPARASFGYAQLQRIKSSDIFDTVLFRLPPGRTEEDYKDAVVFDIEGDSMEPSLRDGQQVIAWQIPESRWEYLHNKACVVAYLEEVTVKAVLKNDLNNTDGLTLHATGGPGGSFTVARKDINSIWEVREFYGIVPFRLLP